MLDEWYEPKTITFQRDQVLWILRNLDMLEVGQYPPNPEGSSYIDAPISKRQVKRHAYFEMPVSIAAEVNLRLERTGKGQLLMAEVMAGYTLFSDEAWQVLTYISGWRRKQMDFKSWVKQRKYRSHLALKSNP